LFPDNNIATCRKGGVLKYPVLESLVGQKVTIYCQDRKESVYYGELLEINIFGTVIKHLNHGREFLEFIPMKNIISISHKVLA
jgi:hypothetical protein